MPKIIHLTHTGAGPGDLVRRYIESQGCEYVFVKITDDMFKNFDAMKGAAMVIVWNGRQWGGALAEEWCRARRIPIVFIEQGLLPQSKTYWVDPCGLVKNSVLHGDLNWVTNADMEAMYAKRAALQQQYGPLTDGGHVLAPLQICNDTQILYNSPFDTMNEFVEYVEMAWPRLPIIARPHPKGGQALQCKRAKIETGGEFLAAAARASVVVGITTTCLYEAHVLGVPTVALSSAHPLFLKSEAEKDRICAGAMALSVDRKTGDVGKVLSRFNVRPKI